MYSETDLNIVAKSVRIYTKQSPNINIPSSQRGHFDCQNCKTPPMSSTKKYVTAIVHDFRHPVTPRFAFLFSASDTAYRVSENAMLNYLARSLNRDWTYWPIRDIKNHKFHVRGWWNILDDNSFTHYNGWIEMNDHLNFDGLDEDDTPDYGIQTFIPLYNGIYHKWNNIENQPSWSQEEIYENTYVHKSVDNMRQLATPRWKAYEIKNTGSKKSQKKKYVHQPTTIGETINTTLRTDRPRDPFLQTLIIPPNDERDPFHEVVDFE